MKMYRTTRPPPRQAAIPVLSVAVKGGEIVVTASGSDYVVTYYKPARLRSASGQELCAEGRQARRHDTR